MSEAIRRAPPLAPQPGGAATPPTARRLDVLLVVLAVAATVAAGLHDLGHPWDGSLRGEIISTYSHRFLQNHLELGLDVTRGGGVFRLDPLAPDRPYYYANHPATCTLLLLPFAVLLGASDDALRVAATLLWLPAVLALWRLARRWFPEPAPGAAALLLATLPMNVLWGPSPHVHVAILPALLLAALAFVRHLERPGRGRAAVLALAVLLACLTDWPGAFALPMLAVLALAWPEPRRALGVVLRLAPLPFVALALVHVHTAYYLRAPLDSWKHWEALFGRVQAYETGWRDWLAGNAVFALDGLGVAALLLAAAGALLSWRGGLAGRRRLVVAVALALPGLLNVLVFRRHAFVHPFWGMYGTAGVALLAAAPWCAEPLSGWLRGGRLRAAARLAPVLLAAGLGLGQGFAEMSATRGTVFRDLGVLLNARYGRGDVVGSLHDPAQAEVYVRALMIGPVRTPGEATGLVQRYAPPAFEGRVGFVMPAKHGDGPVARALRAACAPRRSGEWLVFDLR